MTGVLEKVAPEYAKIRKRRDDLIERRQELVAEAEARRTRNEPAGDLAHRVRQVDEEIASIVPEVKEARRAAGIEAAGKLATDKRFQAQLCAGLDLLAPLLTLAAAVDEQRGEGVGLPPLPFRLSHLVAEMRAYVAELRDIGVLDPATLPEGLRGLVVEE